MFTGEVFSDSVVKALTLRGHQHDPWLAILLGADGFQTPEDGLSQHHHAASAAVSFIVGGSVLVAGEIPEIPHLHPKQMILAGFGDHSFFEECLEHSREDRDEV